MKKNLFVAFLLGTLISSCTSRKELAKDMTFSRENFKEIKELKDPQEIVIDSLLNPANFRVMHDSILVVGNQPNCEYLLEIYSLNTLQPLAQLVTKGNGPNEMFACSPIIQSNSTSDFYLQDANTQTYYTVNIDSILKNRKLQCLSKFKYSSEILSTTDLCLDDKQYIAYHMWYLNDQKFGNNITSPLAVYKKDEDSKRGMGDFPYFVASVNGARLFKNPETKEIWAADMHSDVIRIYNDSLKQVRVLEGPDHFKPEYTQRQIEAPIAFVTFTNDHDYQSYIDYFITDKFVYLVYGGTEHFNPKDLQPIEIFKLDFAGNLICNYKLDRYVYSISVDKSEKILYCASRKSVMEPPVILKYVL